jgi:hypothetical protein
VRLARLVLVLLVVALLELAGLELARLELARLGLAGLVPEELVPEGRAVVFDRGGAECVAVVVGRGVCSVGGIAGLNVATDSIAPATRHTARMLASSGMTDPRPAKGPASRRSRFRRRFARSSRW